MHALALFLQDQPDQATVMHMLMAMAFIFPVIIAVGLALVIVPFWFICKKAGFSPWLSFLFLVPLGNLILYYMLAFGEWKVVPVAQLGWPPQQPPPPPTFPPQA